MNDRKTIFVKVSPLGKLDRLCDLTHNFKSFCQSKGEKMANKKILMKMLVVPAFLMIMAGCKNPADEDNNNSGSTSNPLIGTWADDPDAPDQLILFTDSGNNKGVVYYSIDLVEGGRINTAQKTLPDIFNTGDTPTYSLNNNTLTVENFIRNANTGEFYNVEYTRRTGSAKTGMQDIWIPDIATTVIAQRRLLIIAANNTLYYSEPANWNYDNYEYRSADKEVRWENLNAGLPTPAVISASTGRLTFTLPGDQQRLYSKYLDF
jgi:hypothetical protein